MQIRSREGRKKVGKGKEGKGEKECRGEKGNSLGEEKQIFSINLNKKVNKKSII